MSAITTHVLDIARGRPAPGVPVILEEIGAGDEAHIMGHGITDQDGRLKTLLDANTGLVAGMYRLTFDTRAYFAAQGVRAFYPRVVVTFEVAPGETHYHVPLLLSPFGYTTYRGS